MEDSILITLKNMLGLDKDYLDFDKDLIPLTNSVLMVLEQIGVGSDGFVITGPEETWSDFLGAENHQFESAKTYLYIKVRLLFDPPNSSTVTSSFEATAKELEWRLNVKVEGTN